MAKLTRAGQPATQDGVALDDAARVLDRIEADEAAAEEMRRRIERDGLPMVGDGAIAPGLDDHERILAIRSGTRMTTANGSRDAGRRGDGRLYLTDRRLMLQGRNAHAIPLESIEELSLVGERLLVALRDGSALSFELTGPRELRVIVAAAIAEARR